MSTEVQQSTIPPSGKCDWRASISVAMAGEDSCMWIWGCNNGFCGGRGGEVVIVASMVDEGIAVEEWKGWETRASDAKPESKPAQQQCLGKLFTWRI